MSSNTILIIEDEAVLSEAYTMILQKEGFKTIAAFDGKEALKIVDEQPVDIILLDLRMPHMGGLEFLKEVHKKQKTIPKTIVFSNYDVQKDIDEAFKYGATRYMLKAWASPKELVKVVRDTLGG
ncbi:MAG TPA: response regulator [Patescibacteria group bacterium]|nr:response regulator [Patescibacteria group bacterium]